MRQAIEVKYLGPTLYQGARMKASCTAGSVTVAWKSELDAYQNAERATVELITNLKWFGNFVSGTLPNGNYVFLVVS